MSGDEHEDDHGHGHGHGHDDERGHDVGHGHGHGTDDERGHDVGHGHGHGHGHDDERGHDVGHGHGHGDHAHGLPETIGRAFAVGVALNVAFVIAEAVFGVLSRSTALLADAAHNLSDVLGLLFAWGAMSLAQRRPTSRLTYGMRRSTQLSALASSLLLLVAVGGVAWEAAERLAAPPDVEARTMMIVATIGVIVNGLSAALFLRDRGRDVNVRAAFVHLVADALVSVGVVVAGLVLSLTGWRWIDPAVSLVISAIILWSAWRVLREALHLSLDGVPDHIEIDAVRAYLESLPGVRSVHDLHVWAMSTTEIALTAHLVLDWPEREPAFLATLERELASRFGIGHSTVQLESCEAGTCGRAEPGAL